MSDEKTVGCFISQVEKPALTASEKAAVKENRRLERAAYQKKYDADMKANGFIKTTVVIPVENQAAFTALAKKLRNEKKLRIIDKKD